MKEEEKANENEKKKENYQDYYYGKLNKKREEEKEKENVKRRENIQKGVREKVKIKRKLKPLTPFQLIFGVDLEYVLISGAEICKRTWKLTLFQNYSLAQPFLRPVGDTIAAGNFELWVVRGRILIFGGGV